MISMNDEITIAMGKRLKELRKSKHLTQDNIADMLNISQKTISSAERGLYRLSLEYLLEYCSIFNCSLDYIVSGKTHDSAISKLPTEIYNILCNGSETEVNRLNKYLQIYTELLKKQD